MQASAARAAAAAAKAAAASCELYAQLAETAADAASSALEAANALGGLESSSASNSLSPSLVAWLRYKHTLSLAAYGEQEALIVFLFPLRLKPEAWPFHVYGKIRRRRCQKRLYPAQKHP